MNILILSATAFELNSVKEEIKKIKLAKIKWDKFNKLNFSFFCTWIWNFEAILNLTKYLENLENNQKPDFVLNFWICWYKNLEWVNKKFKNCLQVWKIFWWAKEKEFLVPQFINFWEVSSVYSSEKIIFDSKIISDKNINFVEMETFWIEYILEKTWIPRLYLKFPFDEIWSSDTKNFKEKLSKIKNLLQENLDYKKLFKKIEKFLEKNSRKTFQNIFENEFLFLEKNSDKIWNLTFQDKNNFEKLFFKYKTLSDWKKIWELLKKIFSEEEKFFNNEKKIFKVKKNFLIEKIDFEIEKYLV
jgi:hypothetical protein